MAKHYTEEEIQFIKDHVEKYGIKICAEKLNRPVQGVKNKVLRLNIDASLDGWATNEEKENLKFESNFKKLELDFNKSKYPKELAYFLGFLWSDGYVSESTKRIAIEIVEEDGIEIKHILDKVCTFSIYNRNRKGRKPQMTFYYSDLEPVKTLYSLGKYPHSIESHEKILSFIPEEYHIYFLRGLIDGDGCFYIHDYVRWIATQFTICGNVEQNWDYLIKLLLKYGLNCNISQRNGEKGNSSIIRNTNRIELKTFIGNLYKVEDNIWLPRKYEKAMQIFNLEDPIEIIND